MSDLKTIDVPMIEGLLADRDWTWADLAAAMGVSKSSVSRVVRGENLPSPQFIWALKRVLTPHGDALFIDAGARACQPVTQG